MKKVQDFPTEEGWYWFYGDAFCHESKLEQYEYEWRMARVRKISNGFLYIADGNFFANELPYGYWFKTNPPKTPTLDAENEN